MKISDRTWYSRTLRGFASVGEREVVCSSCISRGVEHLSGAH